GLIFRRRDAYSGGTGPGRRTKGEEFHETPFRDPPRHRGFRGAAGAAVCPASGSGDAISRAAPGFRRFRRRGGRDRALPAGGPGRGDGAEGPVGGHGGGDDPGRVSGGGGTGGDARLL